MIEPRRVIVAPPPQQICWICSWSGSPLFPSYSATGFQTKFKFKLKHQLINTICRNKRPLIIITINQLIDFLNFSAGAVSVLKILRVCRVLRPLRAIQRAKGLKTVIQVACWHSPGKSPLIYWPSNNLFLNLLMLCSNRPSLCPCLRFRTLWWSHCFYNSCSASSVSSYSRFNT